MHLVRSVDPGVSLSKRQAERCVARSPLPQSLLAGFLVRGFLIASLLITCLLVVGCTCRRESTRAGATRLVEQTALPISLSGEVTERWAEISGLAWYRDHLIILPQFPERFADHIFAIPMTRIIAFLDGANPQPIAPRPVAFVALEVRERVSHFDGFEAIGFFGDRAFLTIETKADSTCQAYLVAGSMVPDLSSLTLDLDNLTAIAPQVNIANISEEALVVTHDRIVTLSEVNGANVNPTPVAHLFDHQLQPRGTPSFPTLEYRVTDATALDADGRFWVLNYFFPPDRDLLPPADDLECTRFGTGASHAVYPTVERLLELQLTRHGIERTDKPPVLLQLLNRTTCRNWEGLVRLDQQGFLLMTDEYPAAILAFVPFP